MPGVRVIRSCASVTGWCATTGGTQPGSRSSGSRHGSRCVCRSVAGLLQVPVQRLRLSLRFLAVCCSDRAAVPQGQHTSQLNSMHACFVCSSKL